MKFKKFMSAALIFAVIASLLPSFALTALADGEPTEEYEMVLDNITSGDNEYYKVDNNGNIILKKCDVQYVLSGKTDKGITFANPSADASGTFYVRLNGVEMTKGITQGNNKNWKVVIDVPKVTENTLSSVSLINYEIKGKGTIITTSSPGITTALADGKTSSLRITDTTVVIKPITNGTAWDGTIELAGTADVTLNGDGKYSPLTIGQQGKAKLTLKDRAKLYALQDDMDVAASAAVSGIETWLGTEIILQDNSYLEAEGKNSNIGSYGNGIIADGSITVKDNATLKATAYAEAIFVWHDDSRYTDCVNTFKILGGTVIAESKNFCAIYNCLYNPYNSKNDEDNTLVIKGADVKATSKGYYYAIYSESGIDISDSKIAVKEKSGINCGGDFNVTGSWIETVADSKTPTTITNSVLFKDNEGKVYGNHTMPFNAAVSIGMKLDIPQDATLTLQSGKSFTNDGDITLNGKFVNNGGTVACSKHVGGTASCADKAKCGICTTGYGDKDESNHANVEHCEAKAATTENEGNIEYWHCTGCGKYFSDESCTTEITQESTIVAKVKKSSGSLPTAYTVRFDTNGGSSVLNQGVISGGKATEPTEPTKDGYVFDGWYTDGDFTSEYDFDTKVTNNITLYAKWVEDEIDEPSDDEKDDEPTPNEWKNPFTDVKENDWFFGSVKYASENGLMSGVTNSIFAPNENITRGMFAAVLYRAEGEPAVDYEMPFDDVDENAYYAEAVRWAASENIVSGVTATEFAPDENITREQIAAILYRYAQYKGYDVTQGGMQIREYDDYESISGYALSAMTWAVNTGLLKGKTETTLNPKDFATRAEFAAILQRFIEGNK